MFELIPQIRDAFDMEHDADPLGRRVVGPYCRTALLAVEYGLDVGIAAR